MNWDEQQIQKMKAEAIEARKYGFAQNQANTGLGADICGQQISATSLIEQQVRRAGAMADNVRMLRNQLEERLIAVLGHPLVNAQKEDAPRPSNDSQLADTISTLADFLESEARELQQLISRVRC